MGQAKARKLKVTYKPLTNKWEDFKYRLHCFVWGHTATSYWCRYTQTLTWYCFYCGKTVHEPS